MQQQASDRIGRAAAIVHQFVEVAVTILACVLQKGIEQVAKQLQRQVVAGDHRPQAQEYRMLRCSALLNSIQFGLVGCQHCAALLRREISFVGEVVGAAGKSIDGRHRLAQGRR